MNVRSGEAAPRRQPGTERPLWAEGAGRTLPRPGRRAKRHIDPKSLSATFGSACIQIDELHWLARSDHVARSSLGDPITM